jgi:hypothetical protein
MKAMNENEARYRGPIDVQAEETDTAKDVHAPRHLTLKENVFLTIKVLALAVVLAACGNSPENM